MTRPSNNVFTKYIKENTLKVSTTTTSVPAQQYLLPVLPKESDFTVIFYWMTRFPPSLHLLQNDKFIFLVGQVFM